MSKLVHLKSLVTIVFLIHSYVINCQLRLPALMSSGMVLQQNDTVNLWGWANPSEWVYVKPSWSNQKDSVKTDNGAKWQIKVKTPVAGGPYTIHISTSSVNINLSDIMIGEVWLCSGQSNMEWSYQHGLQSVKEELPTCYNNRIRFFNVPKMTSDHMQDDIHGKWEVCDSNSIKWFSAVGYYFGKKLNQDLNVPIGLINASWGGTPAEPWVPATAIERVPVLLSASQKLSAFEWWPHKPGKSFNAMIAPLTKHNIAGVIWYQGESNTKTYDTYQLLMTTLIDQWRSAWKNDIYFNVVQIAPFKYGNKNIGALLQESQLKLLTHPKTGVVVITDLVDNIRDIHPANKYDVGTRLAQWALSETYHRKGIAYRNPLFLSAKPIGTKMELTFEHCPDEFISKGEKIAGFYISGEQEHWHAAEAKITGNKIVVWSDRVFSPKHIRYGFGNTIIGNVFSIDGLPLAPFRTDRWAVDQSEEKE